MPIGVYPRPSIMDRFWSRVDKNGPNGCWIWTGAISSTGYGTFCPTKGDYRHAHRFSYELAKGKIPDGMTLDHLCRNRACVNPDHLEAVTMKVNLLRGNGWSGRNARKTHCKKGHPLEGDNLVQRYMKKGIRLCRICLNEWRRTHRKRTDS